MERPATAVYLGRVQDPYVLREVFSMTVRVPAADFGRLSPSEGHDRIRSKEHLSWIFHASSPFAKAATASTTR
ncbi:hypothetical protein GCM10010220_56430 [Streptomyces parvulus]|nr:hypothetical protein GCM10010220_56430 [Streptomyces parvulus]